MKESFFKWGGARRVLATSLAGGLALALFGGGEFFDQGAVRLGLRSCIDLLAYSGALALLQMGFVRWSDRSAADRSVPWSVPVAYWVDAALLAALPTFLNTAMSSGRAGCGLIQLAAQAYTGMC